MATTRRVERDSDGWLILDGQSVQGRRWLVVPPLGTEMRRFRTERAAKRYKRRTLDRARRRAGQLAGPGSRYGGLVVAGMLILFVALVVIGTRP